MDFLVDGKLSVISQFLLRYGHKARPYYTQIIDLTKTEEELHADLRKSYKQLVKIKMGYTHGFKSPYITWPYITWEGMEPYKQLYYKVTENPRPKETWDIQYKMFGDYKEEIGMPKGKQLFILHTNKWDTEDSQTAGMFYFNKYCVYYFSGKALPKCNMHPLLWRAILESKQRYCCKSFEMGEQVFSGNEKLMNISKFKRGFGGTTQTRLILEKEQNA